MKAEKKSWVSRQLGGLFEEYTDKPAPARGQQGRDPRAEVRRRDRFVTHVITLSFSRFAFLALGMLLLAVPSWAEATSLTGPIPKLWLLMMIAYTVTNLVLRHDLKLGSLFTLGTLSLDLLTMVFLVGNWGGLHSPAMAAQLLLTVFFALIFQRRLALLPPLLAIPAAAFLGGAFTTSEGTAADAFTLIWYGALCAITFYVIAYLTQRQEGQHAEIVQLEQELKNLAVLDERARLSREIHDGLGAALSGLIIQSEYVMTLTRDREIRAELSELKEAAEEAIDELRRSLSMMREEFELVPSLRSTCESFRNRHRLPCQIEILGQPPRLSSEQQLTIFRILQEALNNAAKHARAKRVTVRVQFFVDGFHLQVIDDGCGFDQRKIPAHHYGLLNMRERARKIGGDVLLESEPGIGTGVTFSLRGIGGEETREAAIPVRYTAQKA